MATGGKWTLFLDSVLSIVVISVVIGYTRCAWHIRLYTDSVLLLLGLGGNVVRFIKNESGVPLHLWNGEEGECVCMCSWHLVYLWVSVAWLLYKDISALSTETNQTMSYFFRCCLWEVEKPHLAQTTVQNHCRHSASRAVSLIQDHLQLSPPRDSLLETGGYENKPLPTLSTTNPTPDWTGRETRPKGLDWKQESLCQVAWHTLIDMDKEVGVSGDVCVWVWHVTQQTCLPECAKQFSTWVLTAKPQHPNQLLSHQRLKPCSYPTISEMLCCV